MSTRFLDTLSILARHRVDFVVVGGVAAELQGAPVNTFDLDILYSRGDENVDRLFAALTELEAEFRGDLANRHLRPTISHLLSSGHKLLRTKLGQLDVLGTIEETTTYEDILPDVIALDLGGMGVQVLGLERLIRVKEKAGRPKDLAVLPILRATLERSRRV